MSHDAICVCRTLSHDARLLTFMFPLPPVLTRSVVDHERNYLRSFRRVQHYLYRQLRHPDFAVMQQFVVERADDDVHGLPLRLDVADVCHAAVDLHTRGRRIAIAADLRHAHAVARKSGGMRDEVAAEHRLAMGEVTDMMLAGMRERQNRRIIAVQATAQSEATNIDTRRYDVSMFNVRLA